ncbi:MAG TPA: lysozyme inhibitor LprI family protein [Limnobacter sp.]|nr:lysozyme inhibitor LprI family protein [Limnobacter sp.]
MRLKLVIGRKFMNQAIFRIFLACVMAMPGIARGDINQDQDFCAELLVANQEMAHIIASIKVNKQTDAIFLKAFDKSQKLWSKHVKAELDMQFPSYNPLDYGSSFTMCQCASMLHFTQARVASLRQWLNPLAEPDICAGSKHPD